MTPLRQRIREVIAADGPIPLSVYMLMCLHDRAHGYYATRPGLNVDFTTAPETSQIFGELLGLWCACEWIELGRPRRLQLIEFGPGRAAMMADMLRAGARAPGFLEAADIALIEASPHLRSIQARRLQGYRVMHYNELSDVPAGPSIIIGNEFLDCLVVRQLVRDAQGWRERQVGLGDDGLSLRLGAGPPADLPGDVIPSGDYVEFAPALETLVASLAQRFREADGRALFIDYGPADCSPGDTLRAYRAGGQVDPLEAPGECDLTADVDFSRLGRIARKEGLAVHGPVSQAAFLVRMGVYERMEALLKANAERSGELRSMVDKLVSPAGMGERFKALALTPQGVAQLPGF